MSSAKQATIFVCSDSVRLWRWLQRNLSLNDTNPLTDPNVEKKKTPAVSLNQEICDDSMYPDIIALWIPSTRSNACTAHRLEFVKDKVVRRQVLLYYTITIIVLGMDRAGVYLNCWPKSLENAGRDCENNLENRCTWHWSGETCTIWTRVLVWNLDYVRCSISCSCD